jgi:hypothetical protein
MAKDHQRLWKHVTGATDESKAVRTLAEILVDREGRALISRLERKEAELCIEILDRVSRDLDLFPSFARSYGSVRASQNTVSKPPRRMLSSSR